MLDFQIYRWRPTLLDRAAGLASGPVTAGAVAAVRTSSDTSFNPRPNPRPSADAAPERRQREVVMARSTCSSRKRTGAWVRGQSAWTEKIRRPADSLVGRATARATA